MDAEAKLPEHRIGSVGDLSHRIREDKLLAYCLQTILHCSVDLI